MEFRTAVQPIETRLRIDHRRPVVLTGSCFTENIGRRMTSDLFDALVNPTGTLYNPLSISMSLRRAMSHLPYSADTLVRHDGLFHSMDHHSSFSSVSSDEVIRRANQALDAMHDTLRDASALIVTFGTARVYRYLPTGSVAANCHKLPAKHFDVFSLSANDIVNDWKSLFDSLFAFNSHLIVIFTVSPIRYKAYGLHESNLDKSALLLAVDRLVKESDGRAVYFPAYEIMLDDLRDYRFYASDMIHPSDTAVDYIYEIFSNSFYDAHTRQLNKRCNRLTSRLSHRFMTDNSHAIDEFRQETDRIARQLAADCPEIARTIEKFRK